MDRPQQTSQRTEFDLGLMVLLAFGVAAIIFVVTWPYLWRLRAHIRRASSRALALRIAQPLILDPNFTVCGVPGDKIHDPRSHRARRNGPVAIYPAGVEMKERVVFGSRKGAELRALKNDRQLAE